MVLIFWFVVVFVGGCFDCYSWCVIVLKRWGCIFGGFEGVWLGMGDGGLIKMIGLVGGCRIGFFYLSRSLNRFLLFDVEV